MIVVLLMMNMAKNDHDIWWNKHVRGKIACSGNNGFCAEANECYSCGKCTIHCSCKNGPIKPPKEWPEEEEE